MILLHPTLEKALGIAAIDDALLRDAIERVRVRCAKVDLKLYRRREGQAALELAAREAIVGTFRDHHPDRNIRIRRDWPWAHVTLKGDRATIELWIGQEYGGDNDGDGIEPFDIVVDRGARGPDLSERIKALLSRKPKHEPELELRMRASEPAPKVMATAAPEKPKSAGRALLDRNKR